jgi:DNA-binding MurR/RpiR family transcriptional regulator
MATFQQRIRETRSQLSPSFEKLARFLLDSYTEAALLTATELAHRLDIDTGTVVRFAQRLGYRGYPELQRELRQRLMEELFPHANEPASNAQMAAQHAFRSLAQALERTRRSFPLEVAEQLISALDEAQRVILICEGAGLGPARQLARFLEGAGYTIHLADGGPDELVHALAGLRSQDLVLAIEVDGATPYLARALAAAAEEGIPTSAIVAAPSSPCAQHAQLILAAQRSADLSSCAILVEALIYALLQMLLRTRPGRYQDVQRRVAQLQRGLMADHECGAK